MTVKNNTNIAIDISINQWGTGGGTGYYLIQPNNIGTWNRSDYRGFIMVVKKEEDELPFYVKADSEIEINENEILDKGKVLSSINSDSSIEDIASIRNKFNHSDY